MNNYIFPKLGFSVLVAVFVPFSATEAWDGSDVQEVSYPNEDGGVIRSDAQLLQTSKETLIYSVPLSGDGDRMRKC